MSQQQSINSSASVDASRTRIEAAIIDLDGTMVDTAPDFVVALNAMLGALRLPAITHAEVVQIVGKGSEHLIRTVLARHLDAAAVDAHYAQAWEQYQAAYLHINGDHAQLFPEVEAGLQAMRDQGLRLACVTNKPTPFAVPLLQRTGLAPWFEAVFGGDLFARKKPHPEPLLKVSEVFGLAPAAIIAIGDSENDALAARAAGMRVLTVPYGYNHGNPVEAIESDAIVATLRVAADWIRDQNR